MKPAKSGFDEALASARLAEAAHLDALVRAQDASALRLDLVRGRLLERLPEDSALRKSMAMRLPPEHAPRLFLDLVHSIALGADGRSLLLERDHDESRELLFSTFDADAMANEVLRRVAHQAIHSARAGLTPDSTGDKASWGQLLYVWLTGLTTGVALLTAVLIYMEKLKF